MGNCAFKFDNNDLILFVFIDCLRDGIDDIINVINKRVAHENPRTSFFNCIRKTTLDDFQWLIKICTHSTLQYIPKKLIDIYVISFNGSFLNPFGY